NELLTRVRTRALTLPPTDELRKMFESNQPAAATLPGVPGDAASHDAPVRKPGSVGRRATDRQADTIDRRQAPDRRNANTRPANDASAGAAALAAKVEIHDDAEPDLIGTEVNDRYRVLELIGEGGMGKVYLA